MAGARGSSRRQRSIPGRESASVWGLSQDLAQTDTRIRSTASKSGTR